MTTVVAAVIQHEDRILICQRRPGQPHELKWEFPGGKLESGETPPDALRRELSEELAIDAIIGDEITRYEYAYPNRAPILLIFYHVTEYAGEPQNLVFNQMEWAPPETLPDYDFLEGDVDFVKRLRTYSAPPPARRSPSFDTNP